MSSDPTLTKDKLLTKKRKPPAKTPVNTKKSKSPHSPNSTEPKILTTVTITETKEPTTIETKTEPPTAPKKKGCQHEDCTVSQPNFNYPGQKQRLYCGKHKKPGMVDVRHRTCESCPKRPNFGYAHEKKAICCFEHKLPDMVDVGHKKCAHRGCRTRPTFNNPDQDHPIYCVQHKREGMVNVVDDLCIHLGCQTRPSYNKTGIKTPLYCLQHRTEDMVNVKDKVCAQANCPI